MANRVVHRVEGDNVIIYLPGEERLPTVVCYPTEGAITMKANPHGAQLVSGPEYGKGCELNYVSKAGKRLLNIVLRRVEDGQVFMKATRHDITE